MTQKLALLSILMVFAAACSGGGGADSASDSSLSTDPAKAGELADIQRAINDAPSGATIEIGPGTFRGKLVIRKSVTIVGAGSGTMIQGPAFLDDAVIEVRSGADVRVADLALSGPSGGIRVRESVRVAIENVDASSNGDAGIEIRDAADVLVAGCVTIENAGPGVRVRDNATNVRIEACEVYRNGDHGVRIRDSIGVTVIDSTVVGNQQSGLRVRDSAGVEFMTNAIGSNTEYGVRIRATQLDPAQVRSRNLLTGNRLGDVRVDD